MFKIKQSSSILPLTQESEEKYGDSGDSEQSSMLDHHDDYLEPKSQSRSWRLWSSNVPWILTTIGLTIYIFISRPPKEDHHVAWSPTDVGKLYKTLLQIISD